MSQEDTEWFKLETKSQCGACREIISWMYLVPGYYSVKDADKLALNCSTEVCCKSCCEADRELVLKRYGEEKLKIPHSPVEPSKYTKII